MRRDLGRFGDFLLNRKEVTEQDIRRAALRQSVSERRFGECLVAEGALEHTRMLLLLGDYLGVPVVRLAGRTVPAEVLSRVDGQVAWRYNVMPVALQRGDDGEAVLLVAMENPEDAILLERIRRHARCRVLALLAAEVEIREAAYRHYFPAAGASHTGRARLALTA